MFKKNHKDSLLAAAAGLAGSLVVSFVYYDHKLRTLKRDHKIELEETKAWWHTHGWNGGIEFGICRCPVEHQTWCNSHPNMIKARNKKD